MTRVSGRRGTYYRLAVHGHKGRRPRPDPLRAVNATFEWAYAHSPLWTVEEARR